MRKDSNQNETRVVRSRPRAPVNSSRRTSDWANWAIASCLTLSACGGKSTDGQGDSGSSPHGTGGADAAGVGGARSGSGGEVATGASNGVGGEPRAAPPVVFGEQGLPLLLTEGDSVGAFAVPEAAGGGMSEVYALSVNEEVPLADLSTHLPHVNFGEQYRVVALSARADRATELSVSVAPWGEEYHDARDRGVAWQGTVVQVGEDWQDYALVIGEMSPLTDGIVAPRGSDDGSSVHLILQGTEPTTVFVSGFSLVP